MESCNLTFIKYSLFFICLAGSNFQLLQHVASLVYHYHRSPSVSQWAKDNEFWQILLVAVCHVADQSRRRPQRWPFCPWWRAPRLLSSGSPVWNLTSVQMISCLSFKQPWHGDIKHLLNIRTSEVPAEEFAGWGLAFNLQNWNSQLSFVLLCIWYCQTNCAKLRFFQHCATWRPLQPNCLGLDSQDPDASLNMQLQILLQALTMAFVLIVATVFCMLIEVCR